MPRTLGVSQRYSTPLLDPLDDETPADYLRVEAHDATRPLDGLLQERIPTLLHGGQGPASACPDCAAVAAALVTLQAMMHETTGLVADWRDVQRACLALNEQMRGFQLQIRGILNDLGRTSRAVRDLVDSHVRCPSCTALVGVGHGQAARLVSEPHGVALVCLTCAAHLERIGLSLAQKRALDLAADPDDGNGPFAS